MVAIGKDVPSTNTNDGIEYLCLQFDKIHPEKGVR